MKTFITRLLVIAFLLTSSFAASAQVYVGGSIGGSYGKVESTDAMSWSVKINPEVGYIINENWAAGASVSYSVISSKKQDETTSTMTSASQLSINPYAVYAPIKFKNFAVCAEMGAVISPKMSALSGIYKAYLTPLLTYSLNDHIILKTALDFASLYLTGTTDGTFSFSASVGGDNALDISDDFSIGFIYKF